MTALIVDAPYLVRRPFEAGGLQSVAGAAAGVILDLRDRYSPTEICLCWEANGTVGRAWGFDRDDESVLARRAIDPDYKSGRTPWNPDLVALVTEMLPVFTDMGCAHACSSDEADDAIAALVYRSCEDVIVWSPDKDLLQLVSMGVSVIRDYRGSDRDPITVENIVERTGLSPQQWTAYLALCGDNVDRVPGVPKVGDKRARAILAACPSIVGALGRSEVSTEKLCREAASRDAEMVRWVEHVCHHLAELTHSYKLVRLRSETELRITPAGDDAARAAEWFEGRGHGYIAKRLRAPRDPWDAQPDMRDW